MKSDILIILSNYYEEISKNLLDGSIEVLKEHNLNYEVIYAPGCFEIPLLLNRNINKFKGFITLGCIIRGETYHFELIANECSRKIIDISNNFLKPVGFGILTCENLDQAISRSDKNKKNKGREAALACINLL